MFQGAIIYINLFKIVTLSACKNNTDPNTRKTTGDTALTPQITGHNLKNKSGLIDFGNSDLKSSLNITRYCSLWQRFLHNIDVNCNNV